MKNRSYLNIKAARVLLVVLCAVLFAACRKTQEPSGVMPQIPSGQETAGNATPTPSPSPTPTPTPIVDMPASRTTADDIVRTDEEDGEAVVTVAAVEPLPNPLYFTEEDRPLLNLTQLSLFAEDEEGGIRAGVDEPCYAYSVQKAGTGIVPEGSTDPEKTYDMYAIVLKEGLQFADGTPVTYDDLLFTLYTLASDGYDGENGIGGLDIYGMRAYNTQVPEQVRLDAARAIAAGITEEGTCPGDFEDTGLWEAVWSGFDEAGLAMTSDIIAWVNEKYSLDAYVQLFLSSNLTMAHIQADPSLQVLYAMKMFGYAKEYSYSKNTMTDCFGNTYDIGSGALTAELFWSLIKQYYGYNLGKDDGINYERPYEEKLFEDYLAEIYFAKNTGVDGIDGIVLTEDTSDDGAVRPCIAVYVGEDSSISDLNCYIAEQEIYGSDPGRRDVLTGAGSYTCVSADEDGVLLEANPNYCMGVERQRYIRLVIGEAAEEETEEDTGD